MKKSKPLGLQDHTIKFLASFFGLVYLIQLALVANVFAQDELIAGQNINMVSGKIWPEGDPFLQRQNEGTLAISTRNEFHLMGGSNDYRTVDLPGLPEGKPTGDSWVSTYFSHDGGGRWISTLLPGYPQDTSALGTASPLHVEGFEASADPVVRAGTHGLFYYSGIGFNRGIAPASAGFVATFMDLNNDERKNTVGYVRTVLFDENADGTSFIDKPWTAVDKPRSGAQMATFDVHLDGDVVSQTVECGNVYVAYARIEGDGTTAIESQIMVSRSIDCGASFSEPVQVSLPNTINQGAMVAVEPITGHIQVAWRQFENATLNCVRDQDFWVSDANVWPVDQIELAGTTYFSSDTASLFPDDEKGGVPWLVLRQLLAAWLNALSGADVSGISVIMAAAEEWLVDNPPGSKPRKDEKDAGRAFRKELRDYNQGKFGLISCGDLPDGGISGLNPDAIIVTRSTDGGVNFSAPVAVTGPNYFPFEQGTTEFSFRTTSYPTMVFDGVGRSYIAYATRGIAVPDADPVGGDSRVVVTTSMDGISWTAGQPIDEPTVPGHQIMPALEFSRGQVFLMYYDFRRDLAGVFDRFIVDLSADPTTPRHSTDVRVAVADAANLPVFTDYSVLNGGSTQASRYPFLVLNDEFSQPFSQQTQFDLPNLPMFKGGTVPFFSDYVDIATLHFITDEMGDWQFDINRARGAPVAHAMWTDNRDVLAPPDGDWTSYVPPGTGGGTSLFDPSQTVPVCTAAEADRTQMRNQNIYTSRLTQGLAAAIPGNNRPLDTIQRAFVGFVQNMTNVDKTFRLTILNQPPAGSASFEQFLLETERDVVVERNSSIAQTIFATSSLASASVDIRVEEIESGIPVPDGLTALMRINPDSTAPVPDANDILTEEIYTPAIFNPAIFNPAIFNSTLLGTDEIGIYNPAIFNPAIFNNPEGDPDFLQAAIQSLALLNPAIFNPAIFNPAIFNPAIFNPAIFNPAIFNPAIFNPAIFNPAIFNPAIFNPAIFNPAIFNPAIFNPAIFNPAIFNPAIFNPAIFNSSLVETSILVENTGNATAAYNLNLDLQDVPAGFLFQLMIYRTYLVPSANGCTLTQQLVQEQLVNESLPDVDGTLFDSDSTSFFLAPGDNVVVTLRIVPDPDASGDPADIDTLPELDLTQAITPQAVDTPGLLAFETESTPASVGPGGALPIKEVAKLLPSDGAADDLFGFNTAVTHTGTGYWAVVGSVFDDDNGLDSGSTYVFDLTGATGTINEAAKFLPSDGAAGDQFGGSALSLCCIGGFALVGAPFHDDIGGTESGAAYYSPSLTGAAGTVNEAAKLLPSDGAPGDLFGARSLIRSVEALVSAIWDDDNGTNSGSVYVFYLVGASGTINDVAKLTPSDGAAEDFFGFGLATGGGGIGVIITAPYDDDNGTDSGSAYYFTRSGGPLSGVWTQQAKLLPSDGAAGDQFGWSVDITKSSASPRAVITSWKSDDNGIDSGSAYVFDLIGATGTVNEYAKLLPSDGAAGDEFGGSVATWGNRVLITSWKDDDNGVDSGSVYAFDLLDASGTVNEVDKLLASDGAAGDSFGWRVAFRGEMAVVGAAGDSDNGTASGSAYAFSVGMLNITNVGLVGSTLAIEGPPHPYTIGTTSHYDSTLSFVEIEARITQPGGVSRETSGGVILVDCSATAGDLPPGSCSFNSSLSATNGSVGSGILTPGPATATFDLYWADGGRILLDTFTVPITLVP